MSFPSETASTSRTKSIIDIKHKKQIRKLFVPFNQFCTTPTTPPPRQEGDRLFHNAEMGPTEAGQSQSQLNVFTASPGEHIIHCNK